MVDKQFIDTFPIPNSLVENEEFVKLSPSEKVLLFYFLNCRNKYKKPVFYCSTREICQGTGMSRATVIHAKKTLISKSFIRVVKKQPYDRDVCYRFATRVPDYYEIEFLFETINSN